MKTQAPSRRCRLPQVWLVAQSLVLLSTVPLAAQTLTTGALAGRVTSTTGEALTNVLVSLSDAAAGRAMSATASRAGTFRFDGLVPGSYTLTVERIGYEPLRLVQVDIRPERELTLGVELTPVDAGTAMPGERIAPGANSAVGAGEWTPQFAVRELPGRSNTVREFVRFSSSMDDGFAAEGLPGRLSSVGVDGTPFRPVDQFAGGHGIAGAALPGAAFDAAQVLTHALDTEWSGVAGALLSLYTLGTGSRVRGSVEGLGSNDALSLSSLDGGSVSYGDIGGSMALRGPLSSGARFSIGLDARRAQTPVSRAWDGSDAAQQLVDTDEALDAYRRADVTTTTALAGFGRVDWSMSERHRVEVTAHAAALPSFEAVAPGGAIVEQDGLDIVASAAVLSQLGAAVQNEARASITSSERSDRDGAGALPFTTFSSEALEFGSSPGWMSARDRHLRVSNAIRYRSGAHALKLGGALVLSGYRYEAIEQRRGVYSFGGVDQFLAGTGVLARVEGSGSTPDWSDRTVAAFAQDRFTAGRDVEITAGIRAERQTLSPTVRRDEEWERLTGLANDEVDAPGIRLSPRASAIWDVGGTGRWLLGASAGIYYDRLDPVILADLQHDDGSLDVRRVVGPVAWPPAAGGGGTLTPRLTVLGSGFEAPRTLRVSGGLSLPLVAKTTFSFSGVLRRTENLPRRTDLNLVVTPAGRDQHGRAIYGTLVTQGGLVAAEPGSNRRFGTYDEVAGIVTDRTSKHWGLSAGLERALADGLGLVVRYTFGQTTDDWFGARHGGWSVPAPEGLADQSDWVEATSDFDVPHRAVAGLLFTGPAGVRIGASYRVQSGRPFTPGFRAGVDANGDGVAGNDPAYVDPEIPGVEGLIARWPCLRESAGAFALRNGCRTAAVHGLDINLAIPIIRFGSGVAAARVDLFDVLESFPAVPDAALYLIDPDGELVTNPVARTVTLPLIANEGFGGALAHRVPGRIIRVGFSINW